VTHTFDSHEVSTNPYHATSGIAQALEEQQAREDDALRKARQSLNQVQNTQIKNKQAPPIQIKPETAKQHLRSFAPPCSAGHK
jgi:hypothetical protein